MIKQPRIYPTYNNAYTFRFSAALGAKLSLLSGIIQIYQIIEINELPDYDNLSTSRLKARVIQSGSPSILLNGRELLLAHEAHIGRVRANSPVDACCFYYDPKDCSEYFSTQNDKSERT